MTNFEVLVSRAQATLFKGVSVWRAHVMTLNRKCTDYHPVKSSDKKFRLHILQCVLVLMCVYIIYACEVNARELK